MKIYDERSRNVADKIQKLKKQRKWRSRAIAGTCLCLVAVLAAVLFIPYDKDPPSVEDHAGNPYYKVIQKVNALNHRPPQYGNAFEELIDGLLSGAKVEAPMYGVDLNTAVGASPSPDEAAPGYVEVTDNQVAGVIEADIFKRSDRYLYHLSGTQLRVYSIAGEESVQISTYNIEGFNAQNEKEDSLDYAYTRAAEMYLSADCTTVTLVMDVYTKATGAATVILNLDVTDPANITEVDYVMFPGSLISTRMADGKLLLIYNYRIGREYDFDMPETYIPSYGKPGDMTCVAPEDILCPDTATSTQYTVVGILDGKTLAVEDSMALMSYAQELYVSDNALYATHSYTKKSKVDANVYSNQNMTKISGIAYGDGQLRYRGSIDLSGAVPDQYAMDEYEGILRVVTNQTYQVYEERRGENIASASNSVTQRNVSLYCVDLSSWEVAASVLGFAPEGERAESVRFDGNMAYVCTAEVITLTDPVYFFDLSDLEHITYTDTGTIDGYSSSLVQWGNGLLLGIGVGDQWQLKIEIYQRAGDKVVSLDAWEEEADFSSEYKSYFIDRENQLVGLAVNNWKTGALEYLLLHFDGYRLNELLRAELGDLREWTTRACLIDGFLYVLTCDGLTVRQIW